MIKEKIGIVTEEEKNEILMLFERKMSLQELLMTLNNRQFIDSLKDDLYEKIVIDTGKTKVRFEKWWTDMAKKYNWKNCENGQWIIDFETNEIYLVSQPL